VPQGPPDAILGITEAFKKDTSEKKINLGVGAYRDDQGKPYVLNSVRSAEEKILAQKLDKEYAPITGVPAFVKAAVELAYGADSTPLLENRIAATQTVSGTGALRVVAEFLAKFYPNKTVYMPSPTWANHGAVFKAAGLTPESVS
jgi:aspartate aminotransferase